MILQSPTATTLPSIREHQSYWEKKIIVSVKVVTDELPCISGWPNTHAHISRTNYISWVIVKRKRI